MPFEFFDRCMLLRAWDATLANALGWVRLGADRKLTLTSSESEATSFFRWRGGTWGWPGNHSEAIISTVPLLHRLCLRASPTGGAAVAFGCEGGQMVLPPECVTSLSRSNSSGWPAGQTAGQCGLFRWRASALENSWSHNVVRMSACSGGDDCSSPISLLGDAGNSLAAAIEVICDSSCGMGINGTVWSSGGNLVIGVMIILALLPIGVCLFLLHRRRYSVDDNQWPVRRRPLSVFLVFEVSWVVVLVSLTPCTLWLTTNLWLNRAGNYMPLMLPGAVGMALCLRPDDPPVIFFSVSLFLALGCLASSVFVYMLLYWSIPFERREVPGGACGGPVFLQELPVER